jgi:protein-disulfide isomerase
MTIKTAISSLALLALLATVGCAADTPAAPAPTAPPNSTAQGDAVIVYPGLAKAGAVIVDVHSDFQCPWCKVYDHYFGAGLQSLARQGLIELRIHPRTLIGEYVIKNDSSLRAAIAATCADTVGAFIEYHDTVFANQPDEGVGYTDTDLRQTFATQAGISGDKLTAFQTCYDNRDTEAWVRNAETLSINTKVPNNSNMADGITGTPTFLANGFYLQIAASADADGNVDEAVLLQVIQQAALGTVQYPLPEPTNS